jgi:cell division protein FtsB
MEDELDEALNTSVSDDHKTVVKQTMTDRSIEGIETTINNLIAKRMQIETEIYNLQDQHRHIVRSLNAFRTALVTLQST